MKEDIIAANLSSIRQSIEELKKNNTSQSSKNVPNWDELVNRIAQVAANEVRILLENRQKKFKEEAVKNVKGEMTYDEYIDSLSERYEDVLPIALKRYHRSVVSDTIIALRAVPPVSL